MEENELFDLHQCIEEIVRDQFDEIADKDFKIKFREHLPWVLQVKPILRRALYKLAEELSEYRS